MNVSIAAAVLACGLLSAPAADYKPGHDKLAAYGLAALVGGGIAAKAGLFAKLGVLLLAGKKFVVLLLAGIAAFARQLFGKKDRGDSGGTVR